jgi:hypothetical protein
MQLLVSLTIGLGAGAAPAAAECAICAQSVVMNQDLADCFLQKFSDPEAVSGEAVAVDLSRCEKSRSIVLALPTPKAAVEEPDTRFVLSRAQIACLRDKLEAEDIELDPSARIDLGTCR